MYNLGRFDAAIALGEYEIARDPLSPQAHNNLGIRYFTARRLDDAIRSYQAVLRLRRDAFWAHASIGEALLLLGKPQAALEQVVRETNEIERQFALVLVKHAMGDRSESDRLLSGFIAAHGHDAPISIAMAVAYRGEADRAFEWLDKAAELQDPYLGEMVFQPYFDSIRNDPQWLPFLRRIGRAPEQLAAIQFDVQAPK